MTLEWAMAIIDNPAGMGDKTWLLTVYAPAANALAAELRKLEGQRCDNGPCKHRAAVIDTGGIKGDPDYTTYWCCVMPDSDTVAETERLGVAMANVLCSVLGGGCRAWEGRDE